MFNPPSQASLPIAVPSGEDEIDLRQVAAALGRQWKLIAGVSLGSLLLSAIYAFSQKPTWEGKFDIVLRQNEGAGEVLKGQLIASNPSLSAFLSGGDGASQLETDVEVLSSTSVLNPIYQFVRSRKPANQSEKLNFEDWKKRALEIKLKKGTSVLNVIYRDSDKQLIKPVLQQISVAYQLYSGKDRRRGLQPGIIYLSKQVAKYRTQAQASLRELQSFALENDLTALLPSPSGDDKSSGSMPITNSEVQRAQAAAKVRTLKQQIALLNRSPDTAVYTGLLIPALNQGTAEGSASGGGRTSLLYELKKVESELAKQSVRFTDQDESIQQLREHRRVLIGFVNQETRGILNAQLVAAEAELAAASRPKEVLLQFRNLQHNAIRDEATLLKLDEQFRELQLLDEQFRGLQLEAARREDSWEMISTPTLLDKPVAPQKGRIMALGLLAGLVLGSSAALVVDRRSGLVWQPEQVQQLLELPVLLHLRGVVDQWQPQLVPLLQGPMAEANGAVALLELPGASEIGNAMSEALGDRLQRVFSPSEAKTVVQMVDAVATGSVLLLALRLGASTAQQLQEFKQQFRLLNLQPLGLLLMDATVIDEWPPTPSIVSSNKLVGKN
jgi:uncharacterized protein involved in exopolysaccharide biosynthesis